MVPVTLAVVAGASWGIMRIIHRTPGQPVDSAFVPVPPSVPVPSILLPDQVVLPATFPRRVIGYQLKEVKAVKEPSPTISSYALARYEDALGEELRVRLVGVEDGITRRFRSQLLQALTARGEVLVETLPESLASLPGAALLSKGGAGILVVSRPGMVVTIAARSPDEAAASALPLLLGSSPEPAEESPSVAPVRDSLPADANL